VRAAGGAAPISANCLAAARTKAVTASRPSSYTRSVCAWLTSPRSAASMIVRSSSRIAASMPKRTGIHHHHPWRKSGSVRVTALHVAEEIRPGEAIISVWRLFGYLTR